MRFNLKLIFCIMFLAAGLLGLWKWSRQFVGRPFHYYYIDNNLSDSGKPPVKRIEYVYDGNYIQLLHWIEGIEFNHKEGESFWRYEQLSGAKWQEIANSYWPFRWVPEAKWPDPHQAKQQFRDEAIKEYLEEKRKNDGKKESS